ncbi:MAG: pyridoxal phosphate-dependent aminotransferase [Candidatus Hydrothermarchaeota archaeon]
MGKVADRIKRIPPYMIAEIEELVQELEGKGKDIVHFDVGDPDFNTPENIREAGKKALDQGLTHYPPYRGIQEFREAIAYRIEEDYGVDLNPDKEIIATPGSKHAIFDAIMAFVDENDVVAIGSPAYPVFYNTVCLAGGKPVSMPLSENFTLDIEKFDEITKKANVAVLNFPNNPTGGVLEHELLDDIAEITKKRDLLIIYDNAYEKIVYDNYKACFPLMNEDLKDYMILIGSLSKTYAMTGWRVGYMVGNEDLLNKALEIEKLANSGVPVFVQKAGVEALTGDQRCVEDMVKEYDARRELLVKGLNRVEGFKCEYPKGTFFAFADVRELGSCVEISKYLIENGVSTVPGLGFGSEGEGYIRFAFTVNREEIKRGISRIKEAIEKYQG